MEQLLLDIDKYDFHGHDRREYSGYFISFSSINYINLKRKIKNPEMQSKNHSTEALFVKPIFHFQNVEAVFKT